jgi:hypothetical protein
MFSKEILGTDTKMSWWDYYINHCWMTGWQTIRNNFITWTDLVFFTDNQQRYTLLKNDDPFEQCYLEFWYSLNDDDVYPKLFLEELMQMAEDVKSGKVKTVPFTRDMFDDLDDLLEQSEYDKSPEAETGAFAALDRLYDENPEALRRLADG